MIERQVQVSIFEGPGRSSAGLEHRERGGGLWMRLESGDWEQAEPGA